MKTGRKTKPARGRWEVQMRCTSGWENIWTENDKPMTFASRADAAADLAEHIRLTEEAAARGDMDSPHLRKDFRIVRVK